MVRILGSGDDLQCALNSRCSQPQRMVGRLARDFVLVDNFVVHILNFIFVVVKHLTRDSNCCVFDVFVFLIGVFVLAVVVVVVVDLCWLLWLWLWLWLLRLVWLWLLLLLLLWVKNVGLPKDYPTNDLIHVKRYLYTHVYDILDFIIVNEIHDSLMKHMIHHEITKHDLLFIVFTLDK